MITKTWAYYKLRLKSTDTLTTAVKHEALYLRKSKVVPARTIKPGKLKCFFFFLKKCGFHNFSHSYPHTATDSTRTEACVVCACVTETERETNHEMKIPNNSAAAVT